MILKYLIKPVEENALNIVLIYRDKLSRDVINNIFKYVSEKLFSYSNKRIVFHVFTNRSNPHYLEDFREIIQNNVLYTIVTRHYGLTISEIDRVLSELVENGFSVEVFIDKNLGDIVDFLIKRGCSVLEF